MPHQLSAYQTQSMRIDGNSVQRLKYFLYHSLQFLKKVGFSNPSLFRFRGDILEISINREATDCTQSIYDSSLYIKIGILLAILKSLIEQNGFNVMIRTFPRFDEPDLIAFLHISGTLKSTSDDIAVDKANKTTFPVLFDKISDVSLIIQELSTYAMTKQLNLNDITNTNRALELVNFLNTDFELINNGRILMLSQRHNIPSVWIQAGSWLGHAILTAEKYGLILSSLNLHGCPAQFMSKVSELINPPIDGFPLLLMVLNENQEK